MAVAAEVEAEEVAVEVVDVVVTVAVDVLDVVADADTDVVELVAVMARLTVALDVAVEPTASHAMWPPAGETGPRGVGGAGGDGAEAEPRLAV